MSRSLNDIQVTHRDHALYSVK